MGNSVRKSQFSLCCFASRQRHTNRKGTANQRKIFLHLFSEKDNLAEQMHISISVHSLFSSLGCYKKPAYLSMVLQSFVGPWPFLQFLDRIHSRLDSLDGGSVRRKAVTYTQTPIPQMGFEPTIPALERSTVIGTLHI
jgi:hypothetical protein